MDRRTFLKTTTIAAGSSLAASAAAAKPSADRGCREIAAPALSRSATELSFATPWGSDVPVLGDAAARIAGRLQQALGESYRVRHAGERSDDADLTFVAVDADHEPGLAFFAGLPGSFGLDPAHLKAWLAAGGGQMLWDDLAAQHGFKPLLAGHTGAGPGLWTSRPLKHTTDLAGSSLAASGPAGSVARALGAEAVDPTPSVLRGALADGRLAAAEWGNPLTGLMLGLADVATHFYRGGICRCGTAVALNIRLGLWERLGAAERIMLEGIAAHELTLALAEAVAHQPLAEQAMARIPTLAIADFPAPLAEMVDSATAALISAAAASSPDAARIRDSYLGFRQLMTVSESNNLSA